MVEQKSLLAYYNPISGFAFEVPGPKPFLSSLNKLEDSFNQYWVWIHDYSAKTEYEDFTVRCEPVMESTAHEAAQRVRHLYGKYGLVVKIEKNDLTVNGDGEAVMEF